MIPKFRALDKKAKIMYEVKSIVFTLQSMLCVNRKAVYQERTLYLDDKDTVLMQSTGLFDKSEQPKEIFEGDIIGHYHSGYQKGSVKMIDGCWVIDNENKGIDFEELAFEVDSGTGVIIGNIYENPELLESVEE